MWELRNKVFVPDVHALVWHVNRHEQDTIGIELKRKCFKFTHVIILFIILAIAL